METFAEDFVQMSRWENMKSLSLKSLKIDHDKELEGFLKKLNETQIKLEDWIYQKPL